MKYRKKRDKARTLSYTPGAVAAVERAAVANTEDALDGTAVRTALADGGRIGADTIDAELAELEK